MAQPLNTNIEIVYDNSSHFIERKLVEDALDDNWSRKPSNQPKPILENLVVVRNVSATSVEEFEQLLKEKKANAGNADWVIRFFKDFRLRYIGEAVQIMKGMMKVATALTLEYEYQLIERYMAPRP